MAGHSLKHRKRWIAAWGQRVYPLLILCVERESCQLLCGEARLFRTRAHVLRTYGTFLYKMVPGVSSLRLPSLARRRGRPRKHGLTTYKSKRSRAIYTARIDLYEIFSKKTHMVFDNMHDNYVKRLKDLCIISELSLIHI